ncbi:MAG: VOC family protein [Mycobacterium sp.]
MTVAVESITFDCSDPDALAAWWAGVVGGEVNAVVPGEFVLVKHTGPNLAFQRVEDPTPGKNKAHIDFSTPDLEAEVGRLVGLGATETGRHSFGDEFHWVVFADPEGNAFCVAPAPE